MTSSRRLEPANEGPLAGRTVVVTRPRLQASSLIDALRARGAVVLAAPAFRIEPVADPGFPSALRRAADSPRDYCLVFTSVNAVDEFLAACDRASLDAGRFGAAFVACVGPATEAALRRGGLPPALTASPHTAAGLVDRLAEAAQTPAEAGGRAVPGRALFPRARDAADTVERGLSDLGILVESHVVYGAVPEAPAPALLSIPDVVTFASSSAARFFERVIDPSDARRIKIESLAACIGPSTEETAVGAGYRKTICASPHTIDGLIEAVVEHFS